MTSSRGIVRERLNGAAAALRELGPFERRRPSVIGGDPQSGPLTRIRYRARYPRARMSDSLILTLTTGDNVVLEVEDGEVALKNFSVGHVPFSADWIEVGDQQLVRRDAIVSVRVASPGESLVARG
jgi:hypothetical protein